MVSKRGVKYLDSCRTAIEFSGSHGVGCGSDVVGTRKGSFDETMEYGEWYSLCQSRLGIYQYRLPVGLNI